MMMLPTTLADLVVRGKPGQPAIVVPDEHSPICYQSLAEQVESLAGRLQRLLCAGNGRRHRAAQRAGVHRRLPGGHAGTAGGGAAQSGLQARGVSLLPGRRRGDGRHRARRAAPIREVARSMDLPVWIASRDGSGRVHLRRREPGRAFHENGATPASRRRGPVPAHQRHHQPAQGRAAHARQPDDVDPQHRRPLPADAARHQPGRHAAVSRPRPDRRDAVHAVRRGHAGRSRRVSAPARSGRRSRRTASPGTRPCRRSIRSCCARADADDAPAQSGLRFIRSCSSALAPATLAQLEESLRRPGARSLRHDRGVAPDDVESAAARGPQAGQRRPGHRRRRRHHGRSRATCCRPARRARSSSAAPT